MDLVTAIGDWSLGEGRLHQKLARAIEGWVGPGVIGFAPGDEVSEGHFGMRLMRDLARDAGGELRVDSAPGAGTSVTLEVPA